MECRVQNRIVNEQDLLDLARRSAILTLRRIAAKHPNGWLKITKEDIDDLIQEAAIKIALLKKKKPEAYPGLLIKAGKQACFNWIFRKRSLEIPSDISDIGDEIVDITEEEISDFILENQDKIRDFLIGIRSKKGSRGVKAAEREVQILSLLARGRKESEIALELGLSRDDVHQVRRKLRKRLRELLLAN